jgi:hypothetical protein
MRITRRQLIQAGAGMPLAAGAGRAIGRHALVARHNPVLRKIDPESPLSVGDGEFAFTADVTGLQSLPAAYEKHVPLCTQSQWGWHSFPIPYGLSRDQFRMEMFDTYGRPVGYATSAKGQERLFNWMRENPHRLNLARIGLILDGRPIDAAPVGAVEQTLDLWTGCLDSRFELAGGPVRVRTCCHPEQDCVSASVESPLANAGRLAVQFDFPYGSPSMNASDWESGARHRTVVARQGRSSLLLERRLDADEYYVALSWFGKASVDHNGAHRLVLSGKDLEFTCRFSARPAAGRVPNPDEVRKAAAGYWNGFWSKGGAVDFSGSTDARAGELERRVVLSQYLTAIQCSGSTPPQETGLTCNSWYGKFHLEMHWWHAAHFALWGRTPLLERSLAWYSKILPRAREKAREQGYRGARWPKMTSLEGLDSPSPIGELLIWQEPHPIAMAELCYRSHPARATLERYAELVFESAEFMSSFAVEREGRYVLGPPVIPAQENHPPRETWNPTFELEYWRYGLGVAQQWRERLGLGREPVWDQVRARLSKLPVRDGVYLAHENCPQTFTERNRDHPSMLAALGVLPGEGVDRETMRRTLNKVMAEWQWADTWGWDFPMVAMTAARLGEARTAVKALFIESPKNRWLSNGHNWQRETLPVYLPGNGGLLAAVAMMAAKWDGFAAPGWKVGWEGLRAYL